MRKKELVKGKSYKEVKDPENSFKLSIVLGLCLILALIFIGYLLFNQFYEARRRFTSDAGEVPYINPSGGPSFSGLTDACLDKTDGDSCQIYFNNETLYGNCTLSRNNNLICIAPPN